MKSLHTPVKRALLGLLLLGSFGVSHQALAHKLNLFAFAEGGTVSVDGYFADGRKAQNSNVKVLDGSGAVLVEGMTDGEGRFQFKQPQKSDFKIVINAGMGHQGEFLMRAADLVDSTVDAPEHAHAPGSTAEAGGDAVVATGAVNGDLEAVVHRAVSEAIKPLVRELTESQQKASISELVGAIGYIFGLLGIFAFYKARQMTGKKGASATPE